MSAERILQVNGVKRVIRPEEFEFDFDFQGSDEPRAWDARPGGGAAPCSVSNVDENAQVTQQVRDTRGGHQTPRTALKERNSDVLRVKGGSLFSNDVSTQLQRDQILRATEQARVSSEPGHTLKTYNVFARCDTTRKACEFDLGRYRKSGSSNGGQAYFEVCVNVGFEGSDEADQQFWYRGKVHNEKDGEKKVVVMFQNVPSPTRSEHMSFLNAAARRILRCMQLCVPEPLSYELPKFQACHVYQLTALPQPARLCSDDLSSLQQWCSTSSDLNQLQLNLPKPSAPQLILLEHPDGCFRVQVFKNAIAVHEWYDVSESTMRLPPQCPLQQQHGYSKHVPCIRALLQFAVRTSSAKRLCLGAPPVVVMGDDDGDDDDDGCDEVKLGDAGLQMPCPTINDDDSSAFDSFSPANICASADDAYWAISDAIFDDAVEQSSGISGTRAACAEDAFFA